MKLNLGDYTNSEAEMNGINLVFCGHKNRFLDFSNP